MLVAIIATIVTLIVVIVGVSVFLSVRKKGSDSYAKKTQGDIKNISSVGVSSSYKEPKRSSTAPHNGASKESHINPQDNIRSRFVAMGVLATAIFGSLSAKLWSIQILSSSEYEEEAEKNLLTTVATPAPRGFIYDTAGVPLAKNRTSLTVLADAEVVQNHNVVQRLSALLGIPHSIVRQRIQDSSSGAQSQRVVARDVELRSIAFIAEHRDAFPGVTTQERTVREYPWGALAAHALGYTGTVSEDELAKPAEGVKLEMGDSVGKSGVEATYEQVLAGTHGQRVVIADATGIVKQIVSETDPSKGNDIYLTLQAPVQLVVDKALAKLVAPDEGVIGTGKGTAASAVVMDVTNGDVIALANYPTYTPESFIGGIPDETWALFRTEESQKPLLNRAIQGMYPAASTYKAFTGLAGLKYGFAGSGNSWTCEGTWKGFGEQYSQKCWEHSGHGTLDFRGGIVNSCDVVFYEIARSFYNAQDDIGENAMQDYIKEFGFGEKTGIDLAGEGEGTVPTREWKAETNKNRPEYGSWVPGDMSNMVIGQGDVEITPLQLAVAYGGIATGKIMKPHLLKEVRNAEGDVVVTFEPEVTRTPEGSEENFGIVRDALHGVATESSKVVAEFNKYNIDAAAKTGTGEKSGQKDYAWFACYAPYENPKYVVTCVVEQGGGGSDTAAPLGAKIMDAVLQYEAGKLDDKMEVVAGSTGQSVPLSDSDDSSRQD